MKVKLFRDADYREKLRRHLLALTIAHAKRVAKLPKWARVPSKLEREYSPPEVP